MLGTQRAEYPRTQMQTFAIGRAYMWASALLPPAAVYVRARTDAFFCIPAAPPAEPLLQGVVFDSLTSAPPRFANQSDYLRRHWPVLFPGDRFALVPRGYASRYFEAWRVWDGPLDCKHRCYASRTVAGAARAGPKQSGGALRGGECPLMEWVWAGVDVADERFAWRLLDGYDAFMLPKVRVHGALTEEGADGAVGGEYNTTHAHMGFGATFALADMIRGLHAARHRMRNCSSVVVVDVESVSREGAPAQSAAQGVFYRELYRAA